MRDLHIKIKSLLIYSKNEIINRFLPGLSEQESREHFQHTIEQSHKYNTFFHRILYHPEKNKFFG